MQIRDYVPLSGLSALAVYYYIIYSKARGRDARQQVHATHFSPDARKTASWQKRCKGGTLPERKGLAWLLAAPESGPSSLIQNGFCAMSPQNIMMCVCVCPWRLALQKEGWRQQMDEIRAVRTVEQLLIALSWSQKWCQKPAPKTGPQYCRKKEKLPKWRPGFWDQGVAYTVSPLCVQWVAETPEPFVCFSGDGLEKASSKFYNIYIYIIYIFTLYTDPTISRIIKKWLAT